jgi:hypothetical protein
VRSVWFAGICAMGLLGGLSTAVTALASSQSRMTVPSLAQAADEPKSNEAKDSHGEGLGPPPPWARGVGTDAKARGKDSSWKQAWRELTPAQREEKMTALAKEHSDGMARWEQCVAAAGEDRQKRAECEKPLPPGLAKRMP